MSALGTSAGEVVARPHVLIVAHRGASADAPENTLPAFALAVEAGADLVECDYRHTREGEPYVLHDETLGRTTNAALALGDALRPLSACTASDVEALDAGTWFDPRFAGVRVPRLDDALTVIQAGSTALIERKAGEPATLLRLLARRGLTPQVVVQAFDWSFLAACRSREPGLVLAALGEGVLAIPHLERVAALGAEIVVWSHDSLDEPAASAAHRRGLKLWAYTVNDIARARALVRMGVDGIITDQPAAMRAARLQRG